MRELLKQAFTVLFARSFLRIAQAVAFLLLARFLTPEGFGRYGLITAAISLAALLGSLGLRQSIAYRLGRGEMTAGESVATSIAVWPVLTLVSAAVVIAICGRGLPGMSFWNSSAAITVSVAGAILVMLLQGVNLGRGDVRAFSATEMLPRTLLAVFVCSIVVTGYVTFATALWAQALSFAFALPVAVFMAGKGASGFRPHLPLLPPMVRYGILFALNLFLLTLCTRLSMFVIEHFHNAAAAGQFFAAIRIKELFTEAASAFGLVLFSKTVRDSDNAEMPQRTARIACWMFWTFSLGALVVVALAPLFLTVLLGEQYAPAVPALRLCAIGMGAVAANGIIYSTIAGRGEPQFGLPLILVSLSVNLALSWLLVPAIGIEGGAIALVAGQYALFVGYMALWRTRFGVPIRDFIIPRASDFSAIRRELGKLMRAPA